MNLLDNILYVATLRVIGLWRFLMYIIIYVGFQPAKAFLSKAFNKAGIGTVCTEPHSMIVHNEWLYHRLICDGTLGLGEAYMDGWWDCERLDEFFYNISKTGLYHDLLYPWEKFFHYLRFDVFNLQTVSRCREVAEKHYDLGNHLYKSMFDTNMIYSCGYWKDDAKNLDEAQQQKMELIGRKLKLKPGMRVLDLGCGWGGLCKFLAETYNVEVVGITISKEGAELARVRCKDLQVEIRLQDYREVNEGFDRIVAVELLEHVGRKNYRSFFELTHRCLSDEGILLIHSSGHDNDSAPPSDMFIHKYIYPNGMLPNHESVSKGIYNLFCIEDWHNFGGLHYDKTLMAWHDNFVKNWHTISHKFEKPESFYRMWTYSLLMGAGLFRGRSYQVWQIVLTKRLAGGYISVR